MKYFNTIEKKATDRPATPAPEPEEPEEPKEPYFSVKTVRRAPKIEDEDVDFVPNLEHPASQSQFSLVNRGSRANSMRSHYSISGNVPYGARVHRASWSSRDFQTWREEDITRADSPFGTPSRTASGNNTAHNSMTMNSMAMQPPLVRPSNSHFNMQPSTPSREQQQAYASQRVSSNPSLRPSTPSREQQQAHARPKVTHAK